MIFKRSEQIVEIVKLHYKLRIRLVGVSDLIDRGAKYHALVLTRNLEKKQEMKWKIQT